jgi:hypothetical protein
MEYKPNKPTKTALLLGIGGLIPYVTISGITFFTSTDKHPYLIFILLAYSATIISFLGAIHWGLTMSAISPNWLLLIWGVTPSLIAWVSLIVNAKIGLCIQIFALWSCLLVDAKIYQLHNLSKWLVMRLSLTLVASTSLLITTINDNFFALKNLTG